MKKYQLLLTLALLCQHAVNASEQLHVMGDDSRPAPAAMPLRRVPWGQEGDKPFVYATGPRERRSYVVDATLAFPKREKMPNFKEHLHDLQRKRTQEVSTLRS